MPTVCLNGIVTAYTDYRDNDRILTLFTSERGRMDCKARNCRKPTAPLLVCAQPFVYGEFEVYLSKDRATVNGCDVRETFYPLREDVDRFFTASCLTQLCNAAIEPESPNEPLFSLLYHTLSFLAYGESHPGDLLCAFLVRYLERIGYRPALTHCAGCLRDIRADEILFFSAQTGGAVCAACLHGGHRISKLALEAMRRILNLSDDELHKVVLKPETRAEILKACFFVCEEVLGRNDRAVLALDRQIQAL